MGLKLGYLRQVCEIDMIDIVDPDEGVCSHACIQCGAARLEQKGRQVPLSFEEIEGNLTRVIETASGRVMIAACLAPYVTTGVDTEPNEWEVTNRLAEKVYELTSGASKMIFPMHGVREIVRVDNELKPILDRVLRMFDPEDVLEEGYFETLKDDLVRLKLSDDLIALLKEVADKGAGVYEEIKARLRIFDELKVLGLASDYVPKRDVESGQRLERTVELVMRGEVAGIVLTVDFGRAMGKIPLENNMASYLRTLRIVRPLLQDDCPGFLAISIQGLQEVSLLNPQSAERAHIFFQEVLRRSGFSQQEIGNLQWDDGREWVDAPRTRDLKLAPWIKPGGACDVLPFRRFVRREINSREKLMRARLVADGSVVFQHFSPGKTYNTSIDPEGWQVFDDVPPIREFVRDRIGRALASEAGGVAPTRSRAVQTAREETSWESALTAEGDIFLIKPFSFVKRPDRDRVLEFLRIKLDVQTLLQYRVKDPKDPASPGRPLLFSDLKLIFIQALCPQNNIRQLIAESSPYREVLEYVHARAEATGVELESEAYYEGEMMALARLLDEALFNDDPYLQRQLTKPFRRKLQAGSRTVRMAEATPRMGNVVLIRKK